MGDTGNALLSAVGIVAALYDRERTGVGQEVATSIVNAGLLHTSYAWIHADGTPGDWQHVDAEGYGFEGTGEATYRLFECADDTWLFVAAIQLHEQAAFGARTAEEFLSRRAEDWFAELDAAGVPVEVVDENYCRTLFDAARFYESGLMSRTWAGEVGTFEDPGVLVGFSDTPGVVSRGPAKCGEHTRELLAELGYGDAEIDRLAADRAVLDAPVAKEQT